MSRAQPSTWRGRSAVTLSNDKIEITILSGGGHIVSLRLLTEAAVAMPNPLWQPAWATTDPALRKLASEAGVAPPGDAEGELLSGIGGLNMCCDVFGAHSKGEAASGLAFHGEAGLSTWEVSRWDAESSALTLTATLRRTALRISRTYKLDGAVVRVTEEVTNLTGFERVFGRAQHATVGSEFLLHDGAPCCTFSCSADRGHTWPTDEDADGSLCSQWKPGTEFTYPHVPRRDGGTDDWRRFPRVPRNSDLATLRCAPDAAHGWFAVERAQPGAKVALTFAAAWERETFPWLMTWEENKARAAEPWAGRTVCRGLEFSSFAFPTSRRDNVERGRLLDAPCFEWLDADATKTTTFHLTLHSGPPGQQKSGAALCGLE
jgi:hypothetical protein